MKENEIISKVKEYLKTLPECFSWKEHGGMYCSAGIPDIIVCFRGRFVAFEVKAENGKVSVLQAITIRKIQSAGGIAAVVRSLDDVKAVLARL